uniref:Bm8830 n=1 Tax=Setaria digitata TaxID=48799 RepID=A0A915PZI2_9BILA
MSIEDSDATLVGLDWETWQRVTQTRGLTAAPGTNSDAAAMPSQKAVCYGFYPSIELESMLLINCKKCGLILKDVGYGHHMRSKHGYHMNSSSSDECQSFLLSPPHRVVSPRLEMPILSPPYRRLSTPIASPKESSGRNGSIISQATSTRYSVEQKDDLKLSLRVSRQEVSSEASAQNNSTLPLDTKDELQVNVRVNRRLNGKVKDKKGKKRRRDSSDEDNFSLEHFRQKKRLSKKEQNTEGIDGSASNNALIRHDNTGDSPIYNSIVKASEDTKASTEIDRVSVDVLAQPASVSVLLPMDKKAQPTTALKSIDNIERLQEDEVFNANRQAEVMADCSERWNEVDLDTHYADLSQDVATCPTLKLVMPVRLELNKEELVVEEEGDFSKVTLVPGSSTKSEKGEMQQNWAPNPILSIEDPSNGSHLCEDSDLHRFYVPSPPQLSPVAEKDCYIEPLAAPIVSPQKDIYHDHHIEENLLLQPHERLIPNGYREMIDLSQPSSLHPAENLSLSDYDAVDHRYMVLEEDEDDVNGSGGNIETHYPIEERLVATGPCLYDGYPRGEVLDDMRNRHIPRDEEDYRRNEFNQRTHPVMEQKICFPHEQSRCPQLVAFVPQKRSNRTCSSPPMEGFSAGGVSYHDVYIDQEQKIYYPNARLLTVPINGKTTVDYPPQTRSSPPDIFSTEQNHGIHDLPDDVERSPQLPSFHNNNMTEGMHREMRDSIQLAVLNQESQQHFNQVDYNLRPERNRISLGRNTAVKLTDEALNEHPYDYGSVASVSFNGTRSSNYVSQVPRKKGYAQRVVRTIRSHTDSMQQPATSQVTPHEVCVPIHGRTVIRPDYRYVYIPSKSSHSTDLDHIYNRQRKDREREVSEFGCTEVRHIEHQSRVEPTVRQVAIQKLQPTVFNRVRSSTTVNEGLRSVKVSTGRRVSNHHSSSGTEKTLVLHPELKNGRNSYPTSSMADVVRINARDRMYQACGLHSYAAASNIQRGATIASKSKQRSSYNSSYQIQQNSSSRQMHRTKLTSPADDMESRFGADYVGSHLLNNGMVRDCSSFASSMENRPNVPHGITVQTAQLRNASFAGIRSGNGRTVTVVPVPVLTKCSNSTHYNDSYQASLFGTVSSSSTNPTIIPLSSFASESRTF